MISVIEKCIKELKPISILSKTNLSSRTDAGVHAVSNTMHIDLKIDYDYLKSLSDQNFICTYLKDNINELMIKKNHLIR